MLRLLGCSQLKVKGQLQEIGALMVRYFILQAVMVDEIDIYHFSTGHNPREELSKYKWCWITFTETGESGMRIVTESKEFNELKHEDLNILFRSANHISTITGRNIAKEQLKMLPFPSKPVMLPGCFTSAQRQIEFKYVDKIEDVLNIEESEEFLGNGFTNRLVVLLSKILLPSNFSLDEVKKKWNATEVTHCTDTEKIDCVSGSEFQSVLFIIDCRCLLLSPEHLTLVVSRAQYEVGIILIRMGQTWFERVNETVSSYLSTDRIDHVVLFDQLISSTNKSTLVKWLQPTDANVYEWRWWNIRMKIHLEKEKEQMMKCIERQPISVQLQLCFAFYKLYKRYDLLPRDFRAWCDKMCDGLDSIDDGTISEVNLLYWSVQSDSVESVKLCVDLLRKRNLLSTEINKHYPNATILHVMMNQFVTKSDISRLLLNCDELEKCTVLCKFENKNIFEGTLSRVNGDFFLALFSNLDSCDLFFMGYLGFESGESEEDRIMKYRQWGGDILFNVIRMESVDAVELGLRLLKRYDHILKYEFSLINEDGKNLLQYAIDYGSREEKLILDLMRLLIEAGFPNDHLLYECYQYNSRNERENVLDTAIRRECWSTIKYLLSDEGRRHIFMFKNKGDEFPGLILKSVQQSPSCEESNATEDLKELGELVPQRTRANSV
ncbi:uncharacterized protein LOC142349840 isoform X2 [Convolutriloba macropyga]|uniref:uncharacterized protein LOC142349840 isoform X2 n=1 Tax=Convolutriloba macropyga TaxID=536237 RepID=UPI003F525640